MKNDFIKINNTHILQLLSTYYSDHKHGSAFKDNIVNVEVLESDSIIKINITVHDPGIFIGYKGEDIDALKRFLNNYFVEKNILLLMKEHTLWKNIYNEHLTFTECETEINESEAGGYYWSINIVKMQLTDENEDNIYSLTGPIATTKKEAERDLKQFRENNFKGVSNE